MSDVPPPPADPVEVPHRTRIEVRFNELDPYGHVNHSQYVSYFEHGRTRALDALGLGLAEMARRGVQVVVTELQVRYRSAAVAGDVLEVRTTVARTERVRSTWEQQIVRVEPDGTETEIASAILQAGVTGTDGRPMRPPPWLFPRMAPLLTP